jgi:hypothetical protein
MHKAKDDIMIFSRNQRRQENYALVLAPYLRDCVRGGVVRGLGERFGSVLRGVPSRLRTWWGGEGACGTVWLRGVRAVLNC